MKSLRRNAPRLTSLTQWWRHVPSEGCYAFVSAQSLGVAPQPTHQGFSKGLLFSQCYSHSVNAERKWMQRWNWVAPPTPGQHHLEIKTSHVSIRSDSSIWRLCSSVLHFCDLKLNGISFGWILNPRSMACDVEEMIHSQRPQVWRL